MKLKFWELKLEDGISYKDNNGYVWIYNETTEGFYCGGKGTVTTYYSNRELIQEITFEEVVDWSKVPIDTKILVWGNSKVKYRKHFAGLHDVTGHVYAWNDGQTSFTTKESTPWSHAEIYKEEEGD